MKTEKNAQLRLAKRPQGEAGPDDFELTHDEVPRPRDGEVLVECHLLSVDPSSRTHWNAGQSYRSMVQVGQVIDVGVAGRVLESNHPDFSAGDYVVGPGGIHEFGVIPGDQLTLCDTRIAPLSSWLGGLYMTGLTAYFGLLDVGKPNEGDVVVVSGAAGATGSIAGQIARIKGASKVVGIAGGAEKCAWLTDELGFDSAIDYKSEDVQVRLNEECPTGINVFFDNVGAGILDAALLNMAQNGRIVLCGGISQYNESELPSGPKNYMQLVIRRCTMQGFIVIDYLHKAAAAVKELSGWIESGELKHGEDIQEGIENTPKTFLRLFEGKNVGKQLVKIAEPPL